MKKLVFTLVAILFINLGSLNAQTFSENYLGSDFMIYKGVLFKLRDSAISGFSHSFYSDLKDCQKIYDNNVIYPETTYTFNTQKDSLMNRIFRVEDIIGKDGNPFSVNSYSEKPIFLLRDTTSKQAIYYFFDKDYEHNFPFLTTKTTYNPTILCEQNMREVDEFTNEININTPYPALGESSSVILYKSIKTGKTVYYLALQTNGSTLNVSKQGVTVLFEDGTKFIKPTAALDIDAADDGYAYSAFIPITLSEVQMFTKNRIKKFRLYIYDGEITPQTAEKFTIWSKCVMENK